MVKISLHEVYMLFLGWQKAEHRVQQKWKRRLLKNGVGGIERGLRGFLRLQDCEVRIAGHLGDCPGRNVSWKRAPQRKRRAFREGGWVIGQEGSRDLHKNFTKGQTWVRLSLTGIQGHLLSYFLHFMLAVWPSLHKSPNLPEFCHFLNCKMGNVCFTAVVK